MEKNDLFCAFRLQFVIRQVKAWSIGCQQGPGPGVNPVAYAGFFNGGVSVTSHRDDVKIYYNFSILQFQ